MKRVKPGPRKRKRAFLERQRALAKSALKVNNRT